MEIDNGELNSLYTYRIMDAGSNRTLAALLVTQGHLTSYGYFIVLRGEQDRQVMGQPGQMPMGGEATGYVHYLE